jgi:putative transposase
MQTRTFQKTYRAFQIQYPPNQLFTDLCVCSKNLYNKAVYLVRQEFFKNGKWLQYSNLYHQLKTEQVYLALKKITDSYIPQQVLRSVEQVWRSFLNALKAWKKEPEKFLAKPRPPGYKPKNGMQIISFPKPRVRIRNATICFPKNMVKRGFPQIPVGNFPFSDNTDISGRLLPFYDRFILELIYEVEPTPKLCPATFSEVIGLDLGVNNLVTSSDGLLVKGGVVKSINQWYNKQLAKYKSLAAKNTHSIDTRRILRLGRHRTNKIKDFLHKTSWIIISHCLANNIGTIVIGYNAQWKQHCKLGKRNTQNFVSIPFYKLVQMLEYKANRAGITVIRVSEAYTSQRCSLCGTIARKNRHSRGLHLCKTCGERLNADYNAACNILHRYRSSLSSLQVVLREPVSSLHVFSPDSGCVAYPVPNS